MWTWGDLKIFVAIHRHPSLREAGRALGLNVSTVSRRLSVLEEGLRAQLFERRGKAWELTDAGRALLRVVERFEGELAAVEREIAGADALGDGVVRLTYPDVMAEAVTQALTLLAHRHPGIALELLPGDRSVDMTRGEADLCVRVEDEPPAELVGRRVGAIGGALYASRDYWSRRSGSLEAGEHLWVDWAPRYMTKRALRWLDELYPRRNVVTRAESGHGVLQAVRAGMGIGALAREVGDREPALVRVGEAPPDARTSIWVLTHPSLRKLARVRVVMEHLCEELSREHEPAPPQSGS